MVRPAPADEAGMISDCYLLRSFNNSPQRPASPSTVADFMAVGFRRQGAERWRRHQIPPAMARQYADLGLSPVDAEVWGVVPEIVEAYLNVGVTEYEAWSWVQRGVMPHDVPRAQRPEPEDTPAPTSSRAEYRNGVTARDVDADPRMQEGEPDEPEDPDDPWAPEEEEPYGPQPDDFRWLSEQDLDEHDDDDDPWTAWNTRPGLGSTTACKVLPFRTRPPCDEPHF